MVHAGARDFYQVALALQEAGLLEKLVTNIYSPAWAMRNFAVTLPLSRIRIGCFAFVQYWLRKMQASGLWLQRSSDNSLGLIAGRIAGRRKSGLIAYSYYARSAFRAADETCTRRILFQLHPHPVSVRRILQEELCRVPAARSSLMSEMEMALDSRALDELAEESQLADSIIVASSFTRRTLEENGCATTPTRVVPYGVDRKRFPPRNGERADNGRFRVMWLGQICQRKGLSYLLDAVRKVSRRNLQLVLRGSGLLDSDLLKTYSDLAIDLKHDAPHDEILRELHSADVFVLPSLVEGFGHAILEAMSSGLPVITTANTCGADIIRSGTDGFLVPIRDSEAIATHLDWALDHRAELAEMGRAASAAASRFTWDAFRCGIRSVYSDFMSGSNRTAGQCALVHHEGGL